MSLRYLFDKNKKQTKTYRIDIFSISFRQAVSHWGRATLRSILTPNICTEKQRSVGRDWRGGEGKGEAMGEGPGKVRMSLLSSDSEVSSVSVALVATQNNRQSPVVVMFWTK